MPGKILRDSARIMFIAVLGFFLLQCGGGSEPSGSGVPIGGNWAFGQHLTGANPNDVCYSKGRIEITQDGGSFRAVFGQLGFCYVAGNSFSLPTRGTFTGTVGDSTVRLRNSGCVYVGSLVQSPPVGASGTVECNIPNSGTTYHFSGTWHVSHGPVGLFFGVPPSQVGVSDTVTASVTVQDADGNPIDRTVLWTPVGPQATVNEQGRITGVEYGEVPILATALPGSELEDTITDGFLFGVRYRFADIGGGFLHTCALLKGTGTACWGPGFDGRLGNGGTDEQPYPKPVAGSVHFVLVSGGLQHSCAIDTDGFVWCWGLGLSGETGNGTAGNATSPRAISGGAGFRTVSAGYAFNCGVSTTDVGYCWGSGLNGRLGNGNNIDQSIPVPISGGIAFAELSVGKNTDFSYPGIASACGLSRNEGIYCWGDNTHGQLGTGDSAGHSTPVLVTGGHHFKAVSAGGSHACGLTTTGQAWCWGDNGVGQLGNGNTTGSPIPVQVQGGLTFDQISAGGAHTCGLTGMAVIYCWGGNLRGQLGNGVFTPDHIATPSPVPGLTFTRLSAGVVHTCALATDGLMYCWGAGYLSQLGTGSTSDQPAPQAVGHQ